MNNSRYILLLIFILNIFLCKPKEKNDDNLSNKKPDNKVKILSKQSNKGKLNSVTNISNNHNQKNQLVIILLQGLINKDREKLYKNGNYMIDLQNTLQKEFPNSKVLSIKDPDCLNNPLEIQSSKVFDNIIKNKMIKKNDIICFIGHSQGAPKAIRVIQMLEQIKYKSLSAICIGGVLEGASALINMEARLNQLKEETVFKEFLMEYLKKLNQKDLESDVENLLKFIYEIVKSNINKIGYGVTDLLPNSNFLKQIKNYLKVTNKDIFLIATNIKFYNMLISKLSLFWGEAPPNLKNKYEKKINQKYSEIITNNKEKNDLLLGLSTQRADNIKNINNKIKRKTMPEPIYHHAQFKNKEVISEIIKYIRIINKSKINF